MGLTIRLLLATLAFLILGNASPLPASPEQGYLVIIGGGNRPERVMRQFAELAKRHGTGRIVVIPNASADPEETGKSQAAEIAKHTERKVDWFNVTKENVNQDETRTFFEGVGGIFFSGGDQSRLTELMNGSRLLELIRDIYAAGGVIGGTSAGAAVQSQMMLTGAEKRYSGDEVLQHIEGDNIVTAQGFGFIKDAIIDQHFIKRSRQNRLISLVLENPDKIGIGVDEQTAVVHYPDNTYEVIGESQVIIYDAAEAVIGPYDPKHPHLLSGHNLKLHILREGQVFDMKTRTVVR
jgi:cyanophycinase